MEAKSLMGPIIVEPIKSQEDLNRIVLELEEALAEFVEIEPDSHQSNGEKIDDRLI